MHPTSQQTFKTYHSPLFTGAALGFLLSLSLLSGDQYGQVNILWLLVLFVVIPVISALLSILPLSLKEPTAVAKVKAKLLFMGGPLPRYRSRDEHQINKLNLIYHGQYAGIGWAVGSILALMLLLLFTDMNFVWRSTLLTPEHLLPVLQNIALPWFFWEAAQPTETLLTNTQNSRLAIDVDSARHFAKWWPFILACQLFYSFILRITIMGFVFFRINIALQRTTKGHKPKPVTPQRSAPPLSTATLTLPEEFIVINWGGFSQEVIAQLSTNINQQPLIKAGPLAGGDILQQNSNSKTKLILVKAWEPPLHELKDYLDDHQGYVYPIELQQDKVTIPSTRHMDEWQRFVSTCDNWCVYIEESEK